MKKIFGLLGWPVKHSLSPAMHNAAFKALRIDAEYKLFDTPPENLNKFLKRLSTSGIKGLNVTIPYKEKVLKYLDKISPEVKLIGACNVIKVAKDGRLLGFNTDGRGFIQHLKKDLKFNPKGKTVALMGAGGAASAVAVVLAKEGTERISIFDIVKNKGKALALRIKKTFVKCQVSAVDSIEGLKIKEADLLINATGVGMKPKDPCLVSADSLHPHLLVYDLIYNPPQTKLLKLAQARRLRSSNGLGMLLYQGIISFKIWTQKKAPVAVMKDALRKKGFRI